MKLINLQFNDILKKKYQENNLIIFCKYLESNKYIQLKLQVCGFILIFNDIYLYGKIFKDKIYKISL